MNSSNSRLLWITNLPAPYRIKIWDSLARQIDLKVLFTLGERNWRNWKLNSSPKWKYTYCNYRILRFNEIEFTFQIRKIRNAIKSCDVVLISGWDAPAYIYGSIVSKLYGKKLVIFYESTVNSKRFNSLIVRAFRRIPFSLADLVVTPSFSAAEAVMQMDIERNKVVTLFNPVDMEPFLANEGDSNAIVSNQHKFLFVGRLIALKNLDNLLLAFQQARSHGDTLTIVGSGYLKEKLIESIIEFDLQDFIALKGELRDEELTKIYHSNHTLLLPSLNEVWGMVVNEALASGMHVVVSDNCGVAHFVHEHQGVYLSKTDAESIARQMRQSRQDWRGRISNPEILKFTPEFFSQELLKKIYN